MATPVIEAGDITTSNNETAETSNAVSFPDYVSGDLIIQFWNGDDDISDTITAPTAGPNGETLILSSTGSGGNSGSGPTQGVVAWIGDATISASTLTWTRGVAEQWAGRTIKVLAGEFDSVTPLGVLSGYSGNTSATGTTILTPAWDAGATDGGGRIVVSIATDRDPILDPPVSGWDLIVNTDHGSIATGITIRDAAATDSESISSVTYDILSDSSSTIGIIVREPAAGVGLIEPPLLRSFAVPRAANY